MKTIGIYYICALWLALCALTACDQADQASAETKAQLVRLNEALDHAEGYRLNLEARLTQLKQKSDQSQSEEERYYYQKMIYEGYAPYRYDSALHYIDLSQRIAERLHKEEWVATCRLARSKVCSAIGLLDEAVRELEACAVLPLTDELRQKYFICRLYFNTQLSIYRKEPRSDEVYAYADSILRLVPEPTASSHLWARFWKETENDRKEETFRLIEAKLSGMTGEDAWYTTLSLSAGLLANALGDGEAAIRHYVDGLCVEIEQASRDVPALSIVAEMAASRHELMYANRFMNAYLDMKEEYPDRVHSVFVAVPTRQVYNATVNQLKLNTEKDRKLMTLLVVLSAALIGFLFFIGWLLSKQIKYRKQLSQTNQQLEENVRQLTAYQAALQTAHDELQASNRLQEKTNEDLTEANYLKETYIGNLFALCSNYLSKNWELKRNVVRKLKAHQYDDLLKRMEEHPHEADMKELNSQFDTLFLSIFPTFIEEFNALLRPEEQIKLHTGEGLNTDLRIYALVRLGIKNSVKIAQILGISAQTVYNARMKMRARSTESEEQFAARVRRLCSLEATAKVSEPSA
ncbi:MAG: DUF6377 domain-containing protein [Parabacteroides sp.]